MAYVGRDFAPAEPSENEVYTLDFVNDLATGDSLLSATSSLTVRAGSDPSPASRLIQGPAITGTRVMQRIAGLLPETDYRLTILANTSQGNTTSLFSHIRCRTQP